MSLQTFEDPMSRITLPTLAESASIVDFRIAKLPVQKPSSEEDFDPRNYRKPAAPISPLMAYFNMIRTGLGAGVLGLPLATSQAGLLLGPIMIIGTGLLLLHTQFKLLWCLNEVSRQLRIPRVPYRYGFRIALLHGPPLMQFIGHHGPTIVAVLMILSQLGICTVFVIFTTDSLRDLMDWESSETAMLVLLIPYLAMELLMRDLKIVSYLSLIGNVLNIIGLLLVFILIFQQPSASVIVTATGALPVFFAFGTCLFNTSALGVVLSLDKALQRPQLMTAYHGVLVIGIMVPTLIGALVGVFGYLAFGTMEENILRSLPFSDIMAMLAIGFYLVAIAFAYPIQCYPAMQVILDVVGNMEYEGTERSLSDKALKLIEMFMRPIFVLTSFLVCYLAPFQGPFVAFVGCLCTTQLSLIFPALMQIGLLYPNRYGKFRIYLIINILLVFLGIITFVCGVYMCGKLLFLRVKQASYATMPDIL